MDVLSETYTNADVLLRPARVAVLFPGDDDWRDQARFAIASVGNYWGGAGFILVPYRNDGTVDAGILNVVGSYDPDHVVALRTTQSERDRISRMHASSAQEGTSIAAPKSEGFLSAPDLPRVDAAANEARKLVARRCTPFKQSFPGVHQPNETITYLEADPGLRTGWLAAAERAPESRLLAVSEAWESDSALSLSVRTGILPHSKEVKISSERSEPDPGQMMRAALAERWSRDLPFDVMESLNVSGQGTSREDAHFWFDEPGAGLAQVRHRFSGEGGAVVIGDTADDFALAYAYERLLGFGVWITPKMLAEPRLSMTIRSALGLSAERIQGQGDRLMLTSSSLEVGKLREITAVLKTESWESNPLRTAATGTMDKVRRLPGDMKIGRPVLELGLLQLVVEEPAVTSLSVPALVGEDSTLHMRAPMSSPIPAKLLSGQDGQSKPYWYVSVGFSQAAMPRGRGVPQQFVDPDQQGYGNQAVRSSREGLSYHSQAGGLILAGTSLASQLYRPKLKVLGMQPWIQAMASQVGLEAVPSLPGLQAQLLSRRLGGRTALVSLVSGQFHPALQIFGTRSRNARSSSVFPQHDGVVLGDDPYPSFQALCRLLPSLNQQTIRAWVDRLAQAELLWRGFVLDCTECSRASFVRLGHVGQRFECSRCLAVNELAASRWRADTNDPPWFYDLHPAFRELMATNGDVVLFAAQKLQQGSWEYADTPELDFRRAGTRIPVAEIDLIAHVDGKVVLVEAKSNGRLGSTRAQSADAARKKVDIAIALRADRIILATSEPHMVASAIERLRSAADAVGADQLEIEELSGLRPAMPADAT